MYGAEHYASVGGIIDYNAVDDEQYIINDADIAAYNDALAGVQNALYFTTKMALEEKYEESMVKVSEAVDNFIVASVQLSVVEEVAEKAEVAQETNAVEDQIAVQEFVETNDVTLKQETVVEYNQSLEDIAVNARDAGAFLAASKSESLTSISDQHAQDYGQSMAEASISYSATNDILSVQWATNIGNISFHDFLTGDYVSAADVLGSGRSNLWRPTSVSAMSLEDTELKIGGVNLKGVWIAIVLSIGTTLAGGIWAVAEFYGRIESVEAAVASSGETAEKLTVLGTNLETIMENQKQLLDLRDRIAEVETTTTANDLLVKQFDEKVKSIDSRFSKINREIDDLWRGLDAASNPLK